MSYIALYIMAVRAIVVLHYSVMYEMNYVTIM